MLIFFFDFWFVAVIVLCILGGIFGIVQKFWEILLIGTGVIAFFAGIVKVFVNAIFASENKSFWCIVSGILQGIGISIIPFYLEALWNIAGANQYNFPKLRFLLFGSFEKIGYYMSCTIVLLAVLVIYFIWGEVIQNKIISHGKSAPFLCVVYVSSVIFFFLASFNIAMYDGLNNSSDRFQWDSPDCVVTTDSTLMLDTELNLSNFDYLPIKKLKAGTKLYVYTYSGFHDSEDDERTIRINGEEYICVSDGKYMGYVKKENIEYIVSDYEHSIDAGTVIYAFTVDTESRFKQAEITLDKILRICDEQTRVIILEASVREYCVIRTFDGLAGMVEKSSIIETKKEK